MLYGERLNSGITIARSIPRGDLRITGGPLVHFTTLLLIMSLNAARAANSVPCDTLFTLERVGAFLTEDVGVDSSEVSGMSMQVGEVSTRTWSSRPSTAAAVLLTFPTLPPRVLRVYDGALGEFSPARDGESSVFFKMNGPTGDAIAVNDGHGPWTLRVSQNAPSDGSPKLVGVLITLSDELTIAEAQTLADSIEALAQTSNGKDFKYRPGSRLISVDIDEDFVPALRTRKGVESVFVDIQFDTFR